MLSLNEFLKDYEKNEKFLIGKIKSGKFKNELSDYYNLFKTDFNRLKFELFLTLRKKPELLDVHLMSKTLKIPIEVTYQIFSYPYKISYFPVYNIRKGGELEKILTVEIKWKNFILLEKDKEKIDAASLIQKKTGKNFFALFSDNFSHTSFMLSLYANLKYEQDILEKYAFTGIIGNDGNIYDIEHLKEKQEASKKHGKILIHPKIIKTLEEIDYWFNKNYVQIPFIQLSNKDLKLAFMDLEKSIKEHEKLFSLNILKYIYNLDEENLSLYSKSFLPEEENLWTDYINKDFVDKLSLILKQIKHKTPIFNIVTSISSLSFGLGVKFGSRLNCNIYHFQSGKDKKYFKVLSMETSEDLRKIKEIKNNVPNILEETEYFSVEIPKREDFSETAVAFYIASHNPFADVEKFLKKHEKEIPLIKIMNKPPLPIGNLPVNDDWTKYVIEINSILNKLRESLSIDRFLFFLSMPSPLAFALGIAIGHIIDIDVYHKSHEKNTYVKVFNTKKIESNF
ncbi:SAVED domain-containing protein [Persephonella sp.]